MVLELRASYIYNNYNVPLFKSQGKTNRSELQINFSNSLLQGKYELLKKGENPNRSELQLTLIIIYSREILVIDERRKPKYWEKNLLSYQS